MRLAYSGLFLKLVEFLAYFLLISIISGLFLGFASILAYFWLIFPFCANSLTFLDFHFSPF
jgi:hypothetical protein